MSNSIFLKKPKKVPQTIRLASGHNERNGVKYGISVDSRSIRRIENLRKRGCKKMGKAYNLSSKQASKQAQASIALFYSVIIFTYTEMVKPFKRHGYPHVS